LGSDEIIEGCKIPFSVTHLHFEEHSGLLELMGIPPSVLYLSFKGSYLYHRKIPPSIREIIYYGSTLGLKNREKYFEGWTYQKQHNTLLIKRK